MKNTKGEVVLKGLAGRREQYHKIRAIKLLIETTNMGLREAKNLVESVTDDGIERVITVVRPPKTNVGVHNDIVEGLRAAGLDAAYHDTLGNDARALAQLLVDLKQVRKRLADKLRDRGLDLPNIRHTSNAALLRYAARFTDQGDGSVD